MMHPFIRRRNGEEPISFPSDALGKVLGKTLGCHCFRNRRCRSRALAAMAFPKAIAASFALLVYASAWLKCHHPGLFACALLNSQPMGFYAPAQIVRVAREHGVTVRPVALLRDILTPSGG